MLQIGLYFLLGFLCAALLALMVAPAIWRRAVVLTRKKIESAVPLTLNEIQADKDQLRAEFAMSTRRLEVSLEQLKERAAEQVIEINRRRNESKLLEDEQNEKEEELQKIQAQADDLRSELQIREERLHQATLSLASADAQMEAKALEFEALERRHREVMDEFDDQKMELAARESRLGGVDDEFRDMQTQFKALREERNELHQEKQKFAAERKRERQRATVAEKQVEKLQTQVSDLEDRLERRERDFAKLRSSTKETGDQSAERYDRLQQLETENAGLNAELAEAALRMEALLKDASGENIENAVAIFEQERRDLQNALDAAIVERDELKVQLSATEISSGEDWQVERRENAIVRERINDLAAQVTAMTAALEGPNSPINQTLEDEGQAKQRKSASASMAAMGEEVTTLADRIRALQKAAESA